MSRVAGDKCVCISTPPDARVCDWKQQRWLEAQGDCRNSKRKYSEERHVEQGALISMQIWKALQWDKSKTITSSCVTNLWTWFSFISISLKIKIWTFSVLELFLVFSTNIKKRLLLLSLPSFWARLPISAVLSLVFAWTCAYTVNGLLHFPFTFYQFVRNNDKRGTFLLKFFKALS